MYLSGVYRADELFFSLLPFRARVYTPTLGNSSYIKASTDK